MFWSARWQFDAAHPWSWGSINGFSKFFTRHTIRSMEDINSFTVLCTEYERAICCVPRHNISVIPLLHGVRTRLSRIPLTEIRLKESEGSFNDGLWLSVTRSWCMLTIAFPHSLDRLGYSCYYCRHTNWELSPDSNISSKLVLVQPGYSPRAPSCLFIGIPCKYHGYFARCGVDVQFSTELGGLVGCKSTLLWCVVVLLSTSASKRVQAMINLPSANNRQRLTVRPLSFLSVFTDLWFDPGAREFKNGVSIFRTFRHKRLSSSFLILASMIENSRKIMMN